MPCWSSPPKVAPRAAKPSRSRRLSALCARAFTVPPLEVADEAGVSTGGLYAHGSRTEELFAATVDRYRVICAPPSNPLLAYFATRSFPDDIPELAEAIETVIRTGVGHRRRAAPRPAELAEAIEAVIRRHQDDWLLWRIDALEFGGHFAKSLAQDVPDHRMLRTRLQALTDSGRLRVDAQTAFRPSTFISPTT